MKEKLQPNKHTEGLMSDRGHVPGWVLITLMTAALVVVLWSLAVPALSAVFNQAMTKVATF